MSSEYTTHVGDESKAVRGIIYRWTMQGKSMSITTDRYGRNLVEGKLMTEAQARSQVTAKAVRAGIGVGCEFDAIWSSFKIVIVHDN